MANLIVKDASHLGREYLQVGYYMEIYFPQKNVRFIAVNDGVDSTVESSNDFNPIRNWANELHAKDTSRKVRAVMKMKAEQGERLGGRPPYGYRKSDGDANTLVPDEDTAPVVKHIFSLCAAGNGPKRIATILTKERVVNPSNTYYRKTGKSHRGLDTTRPCLWSSNSVTSIGNLNIQFFSTLVTYKVDLLVSGSPDCHFVVPAQQLQKHDVLQNEVDVTHIAYENSLPDAVVGNVILLIGGKDLLSLQVLTLDLIEQICVAAVFDVVQDGLRCNGSLLVFEELPQRSCGEGRAHIRNHISDDAFQQVHVTDLVPLYNVLELDRVEQVMKVELGGSMYREYAATKIA